MKELVARLCDAYGPPGFEKPVRDLIDAELAGIPYHREVDSLGNLILRREGRDPGGARIMLAASMDEPGLIASHIDEQGYIRFAMLGSYALQKLPGRTVLFQDGTAGIIASDGRSKDDAPEVSSMFIDVGASNRADCPVHSGDRAVIRGREGFSLLGGGSLGGGPGIASCATLAALVEILRQLTESPHEVYGVFASMGTPGGRGAGTAAYTVSPDLAVILGTIPAADKPGQVKGKPTWGCGPVIQYAVGRVIFPALACEWLKQAAESASIPYQVSVSGGDESAPANVQSAREGVLVAGLAIPTRQQYSALEMVHFNDIENMVRLILASLKVKLPS